MSFTLGIVGHKTKVLSSDHTYFCQWYFKRSLKLTVNIKFCLLAYTTYCNSENKNYYQLSQLGGWYEVQNIHIRLLCCKIACTGCLKICFLWTWVIMGIFLPGHNFSCELTFIWVFFDIKNDIFCDSMKSTWMGQCEMEFIPHHHFSQNLTLQFEYFSP